MRNTLALAAVALLAISAPAFAQSNGSPGASTSGSGSNTPGSGVQPNASYNDKTGSMTNGMNEGRAAAPNEANSKMDSSEPNAATGAQQPRGAGAPGTGAPGN